MLKENKPRIPHSCFLFPIKSRGRSNGNLPVILNLPYLSNTNEFFPIHSLPHRTGHTRTCVFCGLQMHFTFGRWALSRTLWSFLLRHRQFKSSRLLFVSVCQLKYGARSAYFLTFELTEIHPWLLLCLAHLISHSPFTVGMDSLLWSQMGQVSKAWLSSVFPDALPRQAVQWGGDCWIKLNQKVLSDFCAHRIRTNAVFCEPHVKYYSPSPELLVERRLT